MIYIEPLGVRPRFVVFGAGHVGKALAKATKFVGFEVVVCDERAEYATREQVPDADEIIVGGAETCLSRIHVNSDTYIAIMTPDYESDFAAVRAALKTPAVYIGRIGSKRKREALMKNLTEEGYSNDDLSRLTIPIGLAIGAESPEEIAISVVSEIIQKRSGGAKKIICDSTGGRPVDPDGNGKAIASSS